MSGPDGEGTRDGEGTPDDGHAPAGDVTVVVMSRDRCEDLLASLPRHEAPVVLVDNGSTDGTVAAVACHHPRVRVLALSRNAGAPARTIGAAAAATRYVAFADDDSWWAPGALARAARLLDEHPGTALLAARVLLGEQERLDPVCEVMASSPLPSLPVGEGSPGPQLLGFVACAAVVRRDAFLAVGGFDDVVRFPGEEERVAIDLAAAGWGLAYVDELVVHHHPSPRREDGGRRAAGIARSRVLTAVLRLPWGRVARLAGELLASPAGRASVLTTLPRLPAALRARRRTTDDVLHRVDLLAR